MHSYRLHPLREHHNRQLLPGDVPGLICLGEYWELDSRIAQTRRPTANTKSSMRPSYFTGESVHLCALQHMGAHCGCECSTAVRRCLPLSMIMAAGPAQPQQQEQHNE